MLLWKQMRNRKKAIIQIVGLAVLTLGLFTSLDLTKKITQFWSRATGKKAEIVVEADKELGIMPRPWNNFGQGGESSDGMLSPTVEAMKAIKPEYVRLDHIYDFYNTVSKENGQLRFNWEKLDKEVDAILKMGAKPFFALSYMPPALADNVTDEPRDWGEWQMTVKATIEHYSGTKGKNIPGVYYEAWNEPDLFGGWKIGGAKSYGQLYRQTALAANQAAGVQPFKLGGPATTGLYPNWMGGLLKQVSEENLRLDFISWHRYSGETDGFSDDVATLTKILTQYPELALKERIISEWGLDAGNNPAYDNQIGAAQTVAAAREMLGIINKAMAFEITDGRDAEGKQFWGRWGLLTHESTGLVKKPRYQAFLWLNEIGETRLKLSGEGSWVRGIAAKKNGVIQINLVNFDLANKHQETVPITINNLTPGNYEVTKSEFGGKTTKSQITINQGTWIDQVLLRPNEIIRLTLQKT